MKQITNTKTNNKTTN